jgi:hypothetical protein
MTFAPFLFNLGIQFRCLTLLYRAFRPTSTVLTGLTLKPVRLRKLHRRFTVIEGPPKALKHG